MKKLIIILFMFSFVVNSQENWQFKTDKGLHFGAGAIIAAPSLLLLYNATNDWGGSINGSLWFSFAGGSGKEVLDFFRLIGMGKGGGFSLADLCYTMIGAIIAELITIYLIKRKKRKWDTKFNIEF